MNAQVKAGYKQTGVGVIPVEWAVSTITESSEMTTVGFVGSMSHLFTQSGVPVLRGQDVLPNMLDASNTKFISNDTHQLWIKSALKGGDVVIVRVGASAGTSCVIPDNLGEANAASIVVIRPAKKRMDANFLSEIINSDFGKRQVESLLVGGAQPVINTATVAAFEFPLPPVAEQRAIAAALSDMATLIRGLDQLITKKRDIKQAAMQQLLTGQQRLPGFSGEWKVRRLDDIAEIDPESLTGSTPPDYEFNYISLENVDTGRLQGYAEIKFFDAPSRARRKLRVNDILVSTVRPNLMSHLLFREPGNNWVCSTGFSVIRCSNEITSPDFIYFHLFGSTINSQIDKIITGSNYPAINSANVRALEIKMPSYCEQIAIATILSDMDSELSTLECRRDKAHQLKQGMMQELLTGRIRLT